jgi:3'(2'), 5'-bisphosphate nucleotidase
MRALSTVAIEAGYIALELRNGSSSIKADGSPVTAADHACSEHITSALENMQIAPVISEESERHDPIGETFWLIDPLDGTKEFLKESGEFTVNIALIDRSSPVIGVVHAPALAATYYAATGIGAFRQRGDEEVPIRVGSAGTPLRLAVSRDHMTRAELALVQRLENVEVTPMGSSLKFCLVAEGRADVYVRHGQTREWDTAAAQCVVESAGGAVLDLSTRAPLVYGKPDLLNSGFLAYGDPAVVGRVLGDG